MAPIIKTVFEIPFFLTGAVTVATAGLKKSSPFSEDGEKVWGAGFVFKTGIEG